MILEQKMYGGQGCPCYNHNKLTFFKNPQCNLLRNFRVLPVETKEQKRLARFL